MRYVIRAWVRHWRECRTERVAVRDRVSALRDRVECWAADTVTDAFAFDTEED